MKPFQSQSVADQVAGHLRNEIKNGNFSDTLPGVGTLVEHLGVNHKTVKAALKLLETEGILINQGRGLKRLIDRSISGTSSLRIGILYYDS